MFPFYIKKGDNVIAADFFVVPDIVKNRFDLTELHIDKDEFCFIIRQQGEEPFKLVFQNTGQPSAFFYDAGKYRILHLSTHGKADSRVGDFSYLAFYPQPDSLDNELLFVRDIYNLDLNADLVMLSACETAIGELKRGEGIISLARAFAYAGAKSIFTTLWRVNDQSTYELTVSFYRYLKAGLSKDAALRQAKLDYLDSHSDIEAYPFFWAALIGVGDMSKL